MPGVSRNYNMRETNNSFVDQNSSTFGPNRTKSVSGIGKMQNTSMISRTGFIPTQPMERASETLEKINDAFRHINISTFDII